MQNAETSDDRFALWRVLVGGSARWAVGGTRTGPQRLLDATLGSLLSTNDHDLVAATRGRETGETVAPGAVVLAPVDGQEVWASGVTFERSRLARLEESTGGADFYDRVYVADRPELFFKATSRRVRGTSERIGIREDSSWSVPEPEIGLVAAPDGCIVALTIANDVSSRSIEGENPLYLPQAKIYRGSCALGPCLVPLSVLPAFDELDIELRVLRNGSVAYGASVPLRTMRRDPAELVQWLFKALDFDDGVVLLTGTSIVPPTEFTLEVDDVVEVEVASIGCLTNVVELVEHRSTSSHLTSDSRKPVGRAIAGAQPVDS
jgi:2-dehydro-3-deoxy-D-arabinonate dehydratase